MPTSTAPPAVGIALGRGTDAMAAPCCGWTAATRSGHNSGTRGAAMQAESYPFDHAFLADTATRIVNEVRGINRVVYDVTSKPPGTIEWE